MDNQDYNTFYLENKKIIDDNIKYNAKKYWSKFVELRKNSFLSQKDMEQEIYKEFFSRLIYFDTNKGALSTFINVVSKTAFIKNI